MQTLQHSPADIVRWLLIGLGEGTDPMASLAWPIFAGGEPDLPDNAITVYDTAGTEMGRTMPDGKLQGYAGFQVRVRANRHDVGWTKADAIQTVLAEGVYDESVVIGASTYLVHCANRIGDVLTLGKESPTSHRSVFTLNAQLSLKQV